MMSNEIFVVGVGPGDEALLTRAASEILKTAGCVVVAKRHLPLAEGAANILVMEGLDKTLLQIEENLKKGSVAVAVSGDTGVFSYLRRLQKHFPNREIKVIPGVSSLQYLCATLGETWDDAAIVSVHGRDLSPSKIASTVAHNGKTLLFCGPDRDPSWICRVLAERGLDELEVAVGEKLSYPEERIVRGRPSELSGQNFDPLSVVWVANPWVRNPASLSFSVERPRDEDFARSDVPMTREEVRSIILDKLRLRRDSVVWDIGAGTGSVSVSCALLCPEGDVHAVERSNNALELLRRNKATFRAYNLWIHEGSAGALLETLPTPTHVFIGGSGGELTRILQHLKKRGEGIRVVVSGVTLKTICCASEQLSGAGFVDLDVLQLSVSRSKPIGGSVIMTAQNPVTLLSAWTGPTNELFASVPESEGGRSR